TSQLPPPYSAWPKAKPAAEISRGSASLRRRVIIAVWLPSTSTRPRARQGGSFAMKSIMNRRLTVSVGSVGRLAFIACGLGLYRVALKIGWMVPAYDHYHGGRPGLPAQPQTFPLLLRRRLRRQSEALAFLLTGAFPLRRLTLAAEPVSPCRALLHALAAEFETPRQNVQPGLLLRPGAGHSHPTRLPGGTRSIPHPLLAKPLSDRGHEPVQFAGHARIGTPGGPGTRDRFLPPPLLGVVAFSVILPIGRTERALHVLECRQRGAGQAGHRDRVPRPLLLHLGRMTAHRRVARRGFLVQPVRDRAGRAPRVGSLGLRRLARQPALTPTQLAQHLRPI